MSNQHFQPTLNSKAYREALRLRVVSALGPGSFRTHADAYGVNHETLRRWLRGDTQFPAWFVAEVALRTGVSAQRLLHGRDASPREIVSDLAIANKVDTETLCRLRRFVSDMEEIIGQKAGSRRSPIEASCRPDSTCVC
jgi:hypothetical protein